MDDFHKMDPDMLKVELPDLRCLAIARADRESAATKIHRESTQMADVLFAIIHVTAYP
jgi:hypothetical protein